MRKTTTDDKNVELLKMISHLRDHIDIQRIIGLNAVALRNSNISRALLGHIQMSALDSTAIYICKIFEASARNELNSIPGIINSLARTPLSVKQKQDFSTFGRKYGNHLEPTEGKSYLDGTFGLFRGLHSASLNQLKEFRDTIGAHSDSTATIKVLPSHAEFESFFNFAYDFYALISRSINNVGPAHIPGKVGAGLRKLIETMGVKSAKFDFGPNE